jgi:hypothetical protein
MKIPTTLDEAVDQLLAGMTEADKRAYRKGPEDDAGVILHHGLGMAMRNAWGLWHGETALSKWLRSKRIWHGDDCSATIYRALWRRLHDLPIDDAWLAGQAAFYEDFWKRSGLTWDMQPLAGHEEPKIRQISIKRA